MSSITSQIPSPCAALSHSKPAPLRRGSSPPPGQRWCPVDHVPEGPHPGRGGLAPKGERVCLLHIRNAIDRALAYTESGRDEFFVLPLIQGRRRQESGDCRRGREAGVADLEGAGAGRAMALDGWHARHARS